MIIIIINSIYDYYYHCWKQFWKQLKIFIIIIINVENSWKYLLLLSSMLKTVFLLILGWNMTFVFKWACSSKSYIITKIRKHFFKANVYYFWITKLHMQTSDLRFKMLSNAAFKTVNRNGSANRNSLERVNIFYKTLYRWKTRFFFCLW